MTRIDFYSLGKESRGNRFLLSCRLVESIRAKGLRIYVFVPDRAGARHLDRLLWTFKEQSFLPHGLVGETDPRLTPILIGEQPPPTENGQVLINLGSEVPVFFERFERLCEPVDHDQDVRAAGRRRYRHYLALGLELHHHEIRL